MARVYQRQNDLPSTSKLSFDERFSMIVTAQSGARRESKMKRLIKTDDLREPGANLASVVFIQCRICIKYRSCCSF